MRRQFSSLALVLAVLGAAASDAQPVEFDPSDFGKIIVAPRQSTGTGVILEQAFGDYQNEPVIDYGEKSIARRLGMPVGRLDVLYKNGKSGYCTAFIVDAEHLVTNHHCIPGLSGDGVQAAQFVAGYLQSGKAEGAEKFQVATEVLETSGPLDYSVLRVFGDPSARFGTVELADADPEPSEFLWIIGHPQGQVQHISREGCAAADPAISDGKVVHSCDTLGGNSGSPVFRVSDRKVVALHHAGDSRTGYNFAIPMTRILKNSKLLKAAAAPVVNPPPGSACEVLWAAAPTYGCLGYQTFLKQCADHPLVPLARGLADQVCTDTTTTFPDLGKEVKERIAEADRSAGTAREEIARGIPEVEGHAGHASGVLAGLAERRDAFGLKPEVRDFWRSAHAEAEADRDWLAARAAELSGLLQGVDAARAEIGRAATAAEVDAALARVEDGTGKARALLAAAAQRRLALDERLAGLDAEASRIAATGTVHPGRVTMVREAEDLRVQVQADIDATRSTLEGLDGLVDKARARLAQAQQGTAPEDREVAALWAEFVDTGSFESRRAQTLLGGMETSLVRLDGLITALGDPNGTSPETVIGQVREIALQSGEWRAATERQLRDREDRHGAIESEVQRLAAATQAALGERLRAAEEQRNKVAADIIVTRSILQSYSDILADARQRQAKAQSARAPEAAEVAALWTEFVGTTDFERQRGQTRLNVMEKSRDQIDGLIATLRDPGGAPTHEIAATQIRQIAAQSAEWRELAVTQFSQRADRKREIEAREAALREQHAAPPPIVAQCLELAVPQPAGGSADGGSATDFNARAALAACSQAAKVSDAVEVRFGLARARYEVGEQAAAFEIMLGLADEGYMPAKYHVGAAYNSGRGVPRDYDKALRFFEETAAAGYPQGTFSLGIYYSIGRAVRADPVRAAELLIRSIADGNAHPISQLHKLPNATIREMQRALVGRGLLSPGDVDGAFGPRTRSALEQLVGANQR